MAAYAALVSLLNLIDDIENHPWPPICMDKNQVECLTQFFTFLQEFLQHYTSPVDDEDEADPLEMRIMEAAYAAEDIIESYIVEAYQSTDDSSEEVSCINLYQDLHQMIEEMDLIKKAAMEIDTRNPISASSVSLTSSSPGGSTIIVCSEDLLNGIMEKLVGGGSSRQVIPVVGMGGIGKTTVAKTVYSKPLIKEHFDIRVWATISQRYNITEMLSELLSRKGEQSGMSEDELGLELYQYLYGRRFLIVLDDMWSSDAWDKIQRFFPDNENGSRIFVTTRLSQLSSKLSKDYSLQMEFLDEFQGWELFSKTVFGEESCPLELVEIGKEIVGNCRGLPLSIVVVGGLLKKMEPTQGSWGSIRKNLASVVNLENDKHCLRLLKLSYNHLPVYLKPCFLYMGVFEEDNIIRVSRLIKLWVSEGFIKPMMGKSLETIAKGFLKDLVDRNLIQIDKLGSTGNIKWCKIHDLLRDLCLRESSKYGFYEVIGQEGINRQRRVVILRNTSKQMVIDAMQPMAYNARSVTCEQGEVLWCQNFRLLKRLNVLSRSSVDALVFKCVNLRHLDIHAVSSFPSLHSSVNRFWNLHTLIVYCWDEWNTPVAIWKMPQLRHVKLLYRDGFWLADPPSEERLHVMENLHTLKGVKNFKCDGEVVKRIPNMRKLRIKYYGRERIDYGLSNMKCLCKLESLNIYCDYEFRGVASLCKLTLPQSLKSLSLWMESEFEWEYLLEKIDFLPRLEKLKLYQGCFREGKWEIAEGQFLSLKYLELSCGALEHWTTQESSVFPRLEQLLLNSLENLEEIPFQIGNIPTLQRIKLYYCNKSVVLSAKDIVDEQVEFQGEQLSFRVEVLVTRDDEEQQSLAGPNFKVYSKKDLDLES